MLEGPAAPSARPGCLRRQLAARSRITIALVSSLLVFAVYLGSALISYQFVIPPHPSGVFWLPTGMTLALFIRSARTAWLWPGWLIALFLGELVAVVHNRMPLPVGLAWGAANAAVSLTGGLLARYWLAEHISLTRLRDVLRFAGLTVVTVVPGSVIAALGAVRWLHVPSFWQMALTWAVADAIGIILLAPVLLTWTAPFSKPAGRGGEAVALFLVFVLTSWVGYDRAEAAAWDRSLPWLLLLLVAWAAIRFGPRGTALALLLLDLVMVGATGRGMGPFSTFGLSTAEQLLNLQIVVASLGLLMLLLAAAIEEQRAARAQAEAAIRWRDDFLSVASHELHTPLTSLQLSVRALLTNPDQPPAVATRFLGIIERQVQNLTTLVGELLDSTRVREGRVQLHREELDLSELAREVAERAQGLLTRTGSTLSVQADQPVRGYWDRVRIDRILTNLLSNAGKFGAGKPIEPPVGVADGRACIVVQDHGIGIPPERMPHIFGRLEQAIEQRRYGGLGLGLYIVRSLAELHGGSVTVASTPGAGATFTVWLPLEPTG